MNETNRETTRRGFFDWAIAVCSCVAGAAMALPGLMYLWPAARADGSENVEVEGAANMSPGQSTTIQVGGKAVIVLCDRGGFRAFSAICTHLGCLVKWDSMRGEFLCPCHAAVFDKNGKVVSGPPPSPLPTVVVKEIGGKVYVSAT